MKNKVFMIGIALLFPFFSFIPILLFECDICWMFYSYILFFMLEGVFLPLLSWAHNVKSGDGLECWEVNRDNLFTSILSLGIVLLSAFNGLFPFFLMIRPLVIFLNLHLSGIFEYTYEGGFLVSLMVLLFELSLFCYGFNLYKNIRKQKFENIDKKIIIKAIITLFIYIILCLSCLRLISGTGDGYVYGDQPDYTDTYDPYDTLKRAVDAAK